MSETTGLEVSAMTADCCCGISTLECYPVQRRYVIYYNSSLSGLHYIDKKEEHG